MVIRLQERDLDMLLSLSAARYLSVFSLEWLHFPDWRNRYRAFLEKRKEQPDMSWYPSPNLYRRIAAMRDDTTPLIYRLTRTVERARVVYNRLPDAYMLAPAGAELLCTRRGYDLDELTYGIPRTKSVQNLEHSLVIGMFYAALRSALEGVGQQLDGWQGDHLLVSRDPEQGGANYDRVRVAGAREPIPVLPDATFSLAGIRYFVEVDMGTRNLRSWLDKIRAYESYQHIDTEKLHARYQVESCIVLIVAPNEKRCERIAEEVIKVVKQPTSVYRFLTLERVHPTTIRPGWKVIESFAWQRRRVIDRLVELPVNLTMNTLPLWKNPQ